MIIDPLRQRSLLEDAGRGGSSVAPFPRGTADASLIVDLVPFGSVAFFLCSHSRVYGTIVHIRYERGWPVIN